MGRIRLGRWLGGVLVVSSVSHFRAAQEIPRFRTDIWIERPPGDVWQILTATDEYPIVEPVHPPPAGRTPSRQQN